MKVSYNWLQEYLDKKIPNSQRVAEALTMHSYEVENIENIENDYILDVDVLPNRAHDSLSHIGIAREISVLFGMSLKSFKNNTSIKKNFKTSDFVTLKIEDPKYTRRAMKRLVVGVDVKESPNWLKEKLAKFEQKSINNIVDITNFITLETGQPVHVFDFDKLNEQADGKKHISVQFAKNNEKITTLDNQFFNLNETVLVIHDKEKPLDIAGIKGGIDSGIDKDTKRILLSVCSFDPKTIRKTSKNLKIETEASKRFEADISPEMVEFAMNRLSYFVTELSGGMASEDMLDVYPRKANKRKIGVSVDEVNKLLGINLKEEDTERILNKLNFEYKKIKPLDEIKTLVKKVQGMPYKYGASVSYDAPNKFDCSSLTSWLFVQGGISIPRISIDQYIFGEPINKQDLQFGDLVFSNTGEGKWNNVKKETMEFLKGTKVKEGVNHVGVYLGDEKILHASDNPSVTIIDLNKFENVVGYRRITNNDERYVITVPHYRLDLLRKVDLIEEIGRVYGYENINSEYVNDEKEVKKNKIFYYTNKIRDFFTDRGFSEVYNYSFVKEGEIELLNPIASDKKFLRNNLISGLEKSLDLNNKNKDFLTLDEIKIFEIGKVYRKNNSFTQVEENFSLSFVCSNKEREKIEKEFSKEFGTEISEEINLDKLINKLPDINSYEGLKFEEKEVKFKQISQYPVILRDIAVWVSKELSYGRILEVIKKNSSELLVQHKLFDVYEKNNITSYAFHLVFQSHERTLTDNEINKIMEKVEKELKDKGWEVR